MEIKINDHRKIFAVKDEFNKAFPNLKLEFFEKPSKAAGKSSRKVVKHESKTLGESRTAHNKGTISITPNMTVADLKQNFSDVFGLTLEVLRQTGKGWVAAEENEILSGVS